ncbi:MAG: hypothetical protein KA059_03255 [Elusimicrobiales bacterium]|nr:hypothetical protein [Elusimicrobiales bacterium]
MNIVLNGGQGKMGRTIIELCKKKHSDINFFVVDREKTDESYNLSELEDKNIDGIIDFSSPSGTLQIIEFALKINRPILIGTTGISENDFKKIELASQKIPVFYSPNMSIGVNICFHIADILSKKLDCDIHIHETHHKAKKDIPSGTALRFKGIMEKNGKKVLITSSRIGDITGEHQLDFAMDGEKITLQHVAYRREIFASGAVTAFIWLCKKQAGLYNFDDMF